MDLRKFLGDIPYINYLHPAIQKCAAELFSGAKNDTDKVRAVYLFNSTQPQKSKKPKRDFFTSMKSILQSEIPDGISCYCLFVIRRCLCI